MDDSSGIIDPIVQQIVDTIRVSDTIYVSVLNTVQTSQSNSFLNDPSWIAALIALLSLLFSGIIFWRAKRLQDRSSINEINEGWVRLTDSRIIFWDIIDHSFRLWKQNWGMMLSYPWQQSLEDIGDLVELCGIPADLYKIGKRNEAKAFIDNIEANNNESQKLIIKFIRKIYPSGESPSSIVRTFGNPLGKPNYDKFNKSRINLSLAYNNWGATSDMKYLQNRFSDDYCLITTLSWIELILVESLGNKWSSRGNLFKLACEIQKERDKNKSESE